MSKHHPKSVKDIKFEAWLSAIPGATNENSYIRVTNSLLKSPRFHKLKPQTKFTFLCMCMESGGHIEFKFPETTAKKAYGISSSTLRTSIKELLDLGAISYTTLQRDLGKATGYRFNPSAWTVPP